MIVSPAVSSSCGTCTILLGWCGLVILLLAWTGSWLAWMIHLLMMDGSLLIACVDEWKSLCHCYDEIFELVELAF
jgi:hypothetical protein